MQLVNNTSDTVLNLEFMFLGYSFCSGNEFCNVWNILRYRMECVWSDVQ